MKDKNWCVYIINKYFLLTFDTLLFFGGISIILRFYMYKLTLLQIKCMYVVGMYICVY